MFDSVVQGAMLAMPFMASRAEGGRILRRGVDDYKFLNCFAEPADGSRALVGQFSSSGMMTTDKCFNDCKDYQYFGTEYGTECYCGNAISSEASPDSSGCTSLCQGDGTQICGGPSHISVYQNRDYLAASIARVPGAMYGGCAVDDVSNRVLDGKQENADDMTPSKCYGICDGFKYFGVEVGKECFCGNTQPTNIVDDTECSTRCGGDDQQLCGAPNRLSLYEQTSVILRPTVGVVTDATYIGCIADGSPRVLSDLEKTDEALTPQKCAAYCQGYAFFGVSGADDCYCGNNQPTSSADESQCDAACAGDNTLLCGGTDHLNLYSLTTTTNPTVITPDCTTYLGCYKDYDDPNRILPDQEDKHDHQITVEKCQALCADYDYFGLEYGNECYCGNKEPGASLKSTDPGCNKYACEGNTAENCGGDFLIQVYKQCPKTTTKTVTVTNTVTQTKTETDTVTNTKTETKTDTITKTDTETDTITKTETKTDTITKTDTKTETDTITKTDTETETETETDTITKTDTDTITKTETDTITDCTDTITDCTDTITDCTETDTVYKTKTDTITKTDTETDTVTDTETDTVTRTTTDTVTKTDTDTITDCTETDTITDTETDTVTTTVCPKPTPCPVYNRKGPFWGRG